MELEEAMREGEAMIVKGFFDGAMVLLERSVLFGRLDDVEIWRKGKAGSDGQENLAKVVERVWTELEQTGKMDCGCG